MKISVKINNQETKFGKLLKKRLDEIQKMKVFVGFQAGKNFEEDGADICDIAAFNELGTVHIPSRPFLRQSVDDHEDEIQKFLESGMKLFIRGDIDVKTFTEKIGVFQKGKVQQTIVDGKFVPNAPSTIAKKGSDKPLIDTGRMRQSVQFVITKKKSEGGNNAN